MKSFYITVFLTICCFSLFSQTTVEVFPNKTKQSSGIYVKKGDTLQLTVTGTWSLWDKYKEVSGEGHPFKANDLGNWGALVGHIGDGEPFYIGNSLEITSEDEGVLYLYPNKDKYLISNQKGNLNVIIEGGTALESFISQELGATANHYVFDPTEGVLTTNLIFNEGESAIVYAFGSWTMWEEEYPKVDADGHDFVAEGVKWGKLFAGIGTSTGQYKDAYQIGQKAFIKIESKGFLSLYPFLSNYVSSKQGKIDIYVVGGRDATEEEREDIDNKMHLHFAEQVLTEFNKYRQASRLPEIVLDEGLTKSAYNHSRYMVENDSFSRNETDGTDYYTGESPDARAEEAGFSKSKIREMFCQTESPAYSVEVLFNTVYHRLRLLNPDLKYLGYGSYKKGDVTIHVFDFGYEQDNVTDMDYFIFPGDLTTNNPVKWGGYEKPNPLPDGTDTPVGSPVSVLFKDRISKVIDAKLVNFDTGEQVNCVVITPDTDLNNRQINAVIMVPQEPLSSLTTYSVSIKVSFADSDKEKDVSWTFRTRKAD